MLFLNWTFRQNTGIKVEATSDNDESLDEVKLSVGTIAEHFRAPLQAKNVEIFFNLDEMEDAVLYSRKHLNINNSTYMKNWDRLHNASDATQWLNLLQICQLLFSSPFSAAKIERTFSVLKAVKAERRTSLNSSTLEDLLEVKLEGPSLSEFSTDAAIELWWKDSSSETLKAVQEEKA